MGVEPTLGLFTWSGISVGQYTNYFSLYWVALVPMLNGWYLFREFTWSPPRSSDALVADRPGNHKVRLPFLMPSPS